jgi:Asp-tRNA(Asn)/Glu-tRNA(Gln) amidotransferase C subunit
VSVTREQAERIAHLARLRLGPDELERITAELNHILDHVEALRAFGAGEEAGTAPEGPTDQGAARASSGEGAPGGAALAGGGNAVDAGGSMRGPIAEQPNAGGFDLGKMAPDFRDGFFVVPPLPGTRPEGEA